MYQPSGSAKNCEARRSRAGFAVADSTSVLAAHLAELIKRNAYELLSRHETKRLIDKLNDSHPKLVEELIPKLLSLGARCRRCFSSYFANRFLSVIWGPSSKSLVEASAAQQEFRLTGGGCTAGTGRALDSSAARPERGAEGCDS